MKKSFTKQLISLILAVCFTLAFPAFSFAADSNQSDGEAKSESIYNEFKKSDGELICVSKYGDTDKFPENSAEAVAAAAKGCRHCLRFGEKNLRRIRGAYGRQQSLENVRR